MDPFIIIILISEIMKSRIMGYILMVYLLFNVIEMTPKNDILYVHMVTHSHDDVGWLKTVDMYYSGTNNTI